MLPAVLLTNALCFWNGFTKDCTATLGIWVALNTHNETLNDKTKNNHGDDNNKNNNNKQNKTNKQKRQKELCDSSD